MYLWGRFRQGRIWTNVQRTVNTFAIPRIPETTLPANRFVYTKSKNTESRPVLMCHQWEWIRSKFLGVLSLRINLVQNSCAHQNSVEVDRWKPKSFLAVLRKKDCC